MATHSSILAWKIPWTEEPDGLQSMGLQKIGPNLATKQTKLLSRVGLTFQDFFFSHSLSSVEDSWETVSPLCQSFRSFHLPHSPHRNPTARHAFLLLELPPTPLSQPDLSTCCLDVLYELWAAGLWLPSSQHQTQSGQAQHLARHWVISSVFTQNVFGYRESWITVIYFVLQTAGGLPSFGEVLYSSCQ